SGLRRDADGRTSRIAHEYRLDLRTVGGAPQPLGRVTAVARLLGVGVERVRQLECEPVTQLLGNVREIVERPALREQTLGDLLRSVLRLIPLGEQRVELLAGHAVAGGHTSASYARSVRCTVKPSER